jgi:outer membrane protein TolC
MSIPVRWACLLLLLVCGPLVSAQTVASPDSVLISILKGMSGSSLTLQSAISDAVANAPSVRQAEAQLQSAEGSVRKEAGAFDPELFFSLNHLDQKLPTATFFAGAPVLATQQTMSRSGLRMKLPIGTELELSLNTTRLATNSSFAFLNPEHDAYGSLSLRQPLLGGLWVSGRKDLTQKEFERDSRKAGYDQRSIAVKSDAERLYWDLYAAQRDYAVQRLTRDRGQAFVRETELRSKSGLVGPNQVANARTFLAQQELLLIEREEQLDRLSDQLASLMGKRPAAGRYLPSDEPPGDFPLDDADQLVQKALSGNLDLRAAQGAIDAAKAAASAAGWQVLPRVDLVGSLGGSGLAGTNQPVVFGTDTLRISGGGTFNDAISQVSRRKFPDWGIGIEVVIPIGLRSGLGERDRTEAEVRAAEQSYAELSRALEEQVRAAHREVLHGKNRVTAAIAGVEAAQEQVRIGLIEFQHGRLTAFELVRLGEDFAIAQQRYSSALVRTAKAAATLRQLTSGS